MAKRRAAKAVETITHDEASRKNIPTAEHRSLMEKADQRPIRTAYQRRNQDLDPQLVWRGKDEQDWSDLVVQAPPLFIQEKVHPKALIDDLLRRSKANERAADDQIDLFADFNGLPDGDARTEFYRHDANWSNRMILGDSLQVMASLAEREGLRGAVQCIYLDPPYGIKFNSNFQWSTTSRDVKDGKAEHITREPEQVKAFRDTWRDGIHSYLTYLRDRLTVARDLLTESGSIFVQIGDENVHRVRALMDEVFGDNCIVVLKFAKTTGLGGRYVDDTFDYILWFSKDDNCSKFRRLFRKRIQGEAGAIQYKFAMSSKGEVRSVKSTNDLNGDLRLFGHFNLKSQTGSDSTRFEFQIDNHKIEVPQRGGWKTNVTGMRRLLKAGRIMRFGNTPEYIRFFDDAPYFRLDATWLDTRISGFGDEKTYVVQTLRKVVERCILMTTDPGDLVLDPTCGSGTTAYVAEQWGRRWITIDTSRVALALARSRVMGARYPYYLLADSLDGRRKEAELSQTVPSDSVTNGDIRQGFVYERVPHVTLKSIANNAEIDVIHERWQETLEPLRAALNAALDRTWEEWEIPREPGDPWPAAAAAAWQRTQDAPTDAAKATALRALNRALNRTYSPATVPDRPLDPWDAGPADLHRRWWQARIARQQEIDASIAAKADYEYLYDKPYEDRGIVRVAGPFTVESLAPHRTLGVDEDDDLIDHLAERKTGYDHGGQHDFAAMILENLRTAGVQQAHKEDRISFTALTPWPGKLICAEGRYLEGDPDTGAERRAGVFIGPEFGTVARPDLAAAAREAADADYDVLIACAFSYDAHAGELGRLGRVPILKARMNADLHMAGDLKNTGAGNLFVIFGEPDIDLLPEDDGSGVGDRLRVKVNGVDVFHPNTGEVRSDGPDGIACWFIDTDYDEESFFVRHAYFLGASDPYKALKTTLKAEIDRDAWETLHSDTSRPFDRPESGRIAVKVINHLGDEVMKVFRV